MTLPKILIVDDEPFNVDYLAQELETLDYLTLPAFNGQQALDIVETDSPDLILLDIMMPVIDGFEVLKRLKASSETRDIPIIIISAMNDLKSIIKGIELGAEDYLPKPFEPALLKARLSASLERKRLRDLEQLYLKSMERELEIGREIQQGFLPAELPSVDGWEIATFFKSAREVAGDFYDVFFLPDGNLLCVIGDVCDKGVGAALFMTLFRSLIRFTATCDRNSNSNGETGLSAANQLLRVISLTNNYIAHTHWETSMFATIFIGVVNLQQGTFTYINCGHEPAFVISKTNIMTLLKNTGPLVGIMPNAEFITQEIQLQEGDLIFTYTDGVPDAQNIKNEFFGKDRLLALFQSPKSKPSELIDEIKHTLNEFIGQAFPFDDITMLAIKRCS